MTEQGWGALRSRPRRAARARFLQALTLVLLVLAAACSQEVERVPEAFRPTNAHAAYLHSLVQANLSDAALARDWIAAAEAALSAPVEIASPFEESGYFDQSDPRAMGYMFSVPRGRRLDAELWIQSREPGQIFMDLFRLVDDDRLAPVHVATAAADTTPPSGAATSIPLPPTGTTATTVDPSAAAPPSTVDNPAIRRRLSFEPLRDGVYILRLQPELLRSVRYTVRITTDASLSFPVAGHSTGSVQSGFGAEREGGRRSHHGVDIFAPRGTPVLSASAGVVSRVDTTPVGGNVVWVNVADRNVRLYYAHLDTHAVTRGQRVAPGDQIGTVGNTGNAITTPPHLHFGVYARGPVDPFPFLERQRTTPAEISVDLERLGGWSRVVDADAEVLAAPGRRAPVIGALERHTPLYVHGASARWYRVILPDGSSGYVAGETTEPATPLRSERIVGVARVLDRPGSRGDVVIENLALGVEVPVLGAFGDFLYVQTPTGRNGWLAFE